MRGPVACLAPAGSAGLLGEAPLFLRSLEISGFKSIARPTRLEFPPGITALVGSNGSGKSNIVDAIRWCLGEQSMRDLRGQRAEDVIYAGPRRSLGAAEVALTFEDTALGGDGSPSELCIARRLFRSGDSEYLINRQRARLRDVSGALRDLGIDAARHVVVTQGMADSLLSATPIERRALLEHAAGLTGYREQREDARQKLATTARNVETIEIILGELEPRVRLLRRQARAIEEREEAVQRLQSALEQWYSARWQRIVESIAERSEEAHRIAARRAAAAGELSRVETQAERFQEGERAWNRQLEVAMAALHTARQDVMAARGQVEYLDHRLAAARQALEQSRERASRVERSANDVRERRGALRQSLERLEVEREELRASGQGLEMELRRLQEEAAERARVAAARHTELGERERMLARLSTRQEQLAGQLDRETVDVEEAERWLAGSAGRLEALQSEATRLRVERDGAENRLRSATAELERQEEALERARGRLDRLEGLRSRARVRLGETAQRAGIEQRALAGLEEELGSGVLLSLQVHGGWERAAAAALGEWALAGASGSAAGRFHAMPDDGFLRWRKGLEECFAGVGRWADSVITGFESGLANPLLGTVLVAGEAEARSVWERLSSRAAHTVGSPPLQVVTRDGHRWNAVGVYRSSGDDPGTRYLETRRWLELLERERSVREGWHSSIERAWEETSRDAGLLRTALGVRRQEVQEAGRHGAELTARCERTERAVRALLEERRRAEGRLVSAQARRGRSLEEMRTLESELREAAAACGEVEALRDTAAAEHDAVNRRVHEVAERRHQAARQLELSAARESAGREQLLVVERDLARLEAEADELVAAARESEAERCRLSQDRESVVQAAERLARALEEQDRRVAQLRSERPRAQDHGPHLRRLREQLTSIMAQHERSLASLTQLEGERRELAEEIVRELHVAPDRLPAVDADQAPSDEEIRRLRSRATQYADADPSIVEEYRALSARQDGLRRHVEDLTSAAASLKEIMARADREMNARFASALAAVSEEFSRVFRLMLQGGDAHLDLADSDGGIEVRAQLPGRRARASSAFSGGERALVASSLLFGVLRIRPTPFCILDEVDAALDESNVDRYLTVLRDISERTQIIVVTHNRATMAVADVLYGLTMDDEGVSSILSLRLAEYGEAV